MKIEIGPFRWHRATLEGKEWLVALRQVMQPDGRTTQGFAICPHAVGELLRFASHPTAMLAEKKEGWRHAALELDGTTWFIGVDPSMELAAARLGAASESRDFVRLLIVCVLAAVIAGALAVVVVWQAERMAHQRSRFAASAAHELRTPLAGLRMYGEMLADGLGDPDKSKDYARRIGQEAERLGRVVDNVLGFTRLERGLLHVQPTEGDLAEALCACIETQRPNLEKRGAAVALELPERLPPVRFDRDALFQIVQNLLDNAEKYSRAASDRTIRVTVELSRREVVLRIADRGPGIPAAQRRDLFRPFQRGENNDVPEGLGLGLMLTRTLARLHGGDVRYADRRDGGAVLSVHLPA